MQKYAQAEKFLQKSFMLAQKGFTKCFRIAESVHIENLAFLTFKYPQLMKLIKEMNVSINSDACQNIYEFIKMLKIKSELYYKQTVE